VSPPAWRVWTALSIVYVVWGSTYLAIAYVVDSLPALLSAAARFAAAAAVLLGWVAARSGRVAFRVTRRQAAGAALVGLLLLAGGNGLVVLAEDAALPSGLAALLAAAVPLWVVLLRIAGKDRPTRRTSVGIVLGFAGVALLLLPGARPEGIVLGPVLLVVLASLLWSLGSFAATRIALPRNPLVTTAVQMAAGAAGLAVVGVARGEQLAVTDASPASWLALGYLVVFGSLVAFTAYSWLLSVAPVSTVATYAYVNPVVAVALGALLRGEQIRPVTVAGGAVTVLAVALVVRSQTQRRMPAEPEVPVDAPLPPRRSGR
jgi:drug/metabolite transporter (DMT)-like permease